MLTVTPFISHTDICIEGNYSSYCAGILMLLHVL